MTKTSESWGTRVGLILAMAGNAVGLGNFLRFPVQAVENGGGAFIIPYLVCFLLMGIPLLWIEWSMGRFGGKFGHHSTPFILDSMDKRKFWKYLGVFGIFTNIAVASYYCYIESWTLSYVFHSIGGTFSGLDQDAVAQFFNKYLTLGKSTTGIPYEAVVFFIACLGLNTYILSRGLKGIEKAAKIGVPMLLIFGALLAVRSLTMGDSFASAEHPDADAWAGINFLFEPQFSSLSDPKVWLAAAGQIFFTLSVGMGTIHCYSAYLKSKDDVALNAVSAGFTNEFVEVVLGSLIVIPIAAGYLGLDWVKENAGFGMAFQTMPYLFDQWGDVLSLLAGLFWFGLLFFAGITSSLAMGTPWMGFMQDEFSMSRNKSALSFGLIILALGLPTVLLYQVASDGGVDQIVFNEYDYWAGTMSLVVFALAEAVLFSWVFGMTKGWKEINEGADIKIPIIFKYILRYVTPTMLIFIFLASVFKPQVPPMNQSYTTSLNMIDLDNSFKILSVNGDSGVLSYNQSIKLNNESIEILSIRNKIPTSFINGDNKSSIVQKDTFKVQSPSGDSNTYMLNQQIDFTVKPGNNDSSVVSIKQHAVLTPLKPGSLWANPYTNDTVINFSVPTYQPDAWVTSFQSLFSGNGWTLDNGSIISMLGNTGLNEQIAAATDADTIETLKQKKLYTNIARTLLAGMFIGVSLLVYIAYKKRQKEGRATS